MKTIYNKIIPFPGYKAINLFGVVFVRTGARFTEMDANHESIHTEQMKELLYIPFYILYLLEWVFRLFQHGFKQTAAYRDISFEREAFKYQEDMEYLNNRKHFAEWKKP